MNRTAARTAFICCAAVAMLGVVPAVALSTASGAVAAGRNVAAAGVPRCRPVAPRFHTRPDIRLAGVCLSARAAGVAPGFILVTTKTGSAGHRGLLMLDNAGAVVWALERRYDVNDLKVVSYQGQRLLAWHEGGPTPGRSSRGSYYLMNNHYQIVGGTSIGDGLYTDMHDLQLTRQGTALLLSHPDMLDPSTGTTMRDFLIREIDLHTGAVLFEWRARDHLPQSASYYATPKGSKLWEPYHGNSVRETADGNLLVSLRNTSAIYKIDRKTGAIIWTLGGRRDSFDLVAKHPGWQFCHQHDASELANGHLLLFDNGSSSTACPHHEARAEEFALDTRARTVRLVREFRSTVASPDGRGYHAWYVGSAQRLAQGDTLVSWGQLPHVTEFTPDGRVNFALTLATWTYRAVRATWLGLPLDKPAVAVHREARTLTVWASWNGATRVASWTLLAGAAPSSLVPVGPPVRRTGFETTLAAPTSAKFVAVRAKDRNGTGLGRSNTIAAR